MLCSIAIMFLLRTTMMDMNRVRITMIGRYTVAEAAIRAKWGGSHSR